MTEPEDEYTRLQREIVRATTEARELANTSLPGNALVLRSGEVPAEGQKRVLAEIRGKALAKAKEVKALQEQLQEVMRRQMSDLAAVLAPLQQQAKQLGEAIWTVNLYLGVSEEIVTLRDGSPAPADTILTVRQQVLSMDEETAVHAGQGGIDFRNLAVFDEWISNPANLVQVLPEPKGVVALVPRERGRDYGDPWANVTMNEENRWTYFLIRNGDALYRMRADFVVGKNLIPTSAEFTALFRTRRHNFGTGTSEVVDVRPGTYEWDKAMEAQGEKQRHYMRVAMILQGLVDRTAVFAPLPEGGLDLMSDRTYTSGRARLVRDNEVTVTDGRELFSDWLKRLNSHLRPGMRIIGAFHSQTFKRAGEEGGYGNDYSSNWRISPRASSQYTVDKPQDAVIYRLEGWKTVQGERGLFFRFERTTERYYGSGYNSEVRPPKTKGSCLILPSDQFVLPFDLVTVEEMRYYLTSRTNRAAYEEMMPLLHAAIAAKEAEQAAEALMRVLLAGEIVKAHRVDLADAEAAVSDLVDWWKVTNQWHRPLVAGEDPAAEKKAVRMIVAEYGARTKAEEAVDEQGEAAVVARLLAEHPDIMVIGRKRDGGYLAFAPQPRVYGPDVAADNMWTVEYTTGTTAKTVTSREWTLPGARMARTRILHTTNLWEGWNRATNVNSDLTDPEITTLAALVRHRVVATAAAGQFDNADAFEGLVLGVTHDRKNRNFEVWMTPAASPKIPTSATVGSRLPSITYGRVRISWTKTRGVATANLGPQWSRGYFRTDQNPHGDGPGNPWGRVHDGRSRDPRPVIVDPEVQQIAADRKKAIDVYNNEVSRLDGIVNFAERSIEAAWKAEALEVIRLKFIADYLDETLWEAHSKTVRVKYPHEGRWRGFDGYRRNVPDSIYEPLVTLVDARTPIGGLTVRDIVTQGGGDVTQVPDDLLDLRIPAKTD